MARFERNSNKSLGALPPLFLVFVNVCQQHSKEGDLGECEDKRQCVGTVERRLVLASRESVYLILKGHDAGLKNR